MFAFNYIKMDRRLLVQCHGCGATYIRPTMTLFMQNIRAICMQNPDANKIIISYIDSVVMELHAEINVIQHKDVLNRAFARLIFMFTNKNSADFLIPENTIDIITGIFNVAIMGTLTLDPEEINYIKSYDRPLSEIAFVDKPIAVPHNKAVPRTRDIFSFDGSRKATPNHPQTPGRCGLCNYGASCFVNAIIQALYACNERERKFCDNIADGNTLLKALCQTFTEMDNKITELWLETVPFTEALTDLGTRNGGDMPCYKGHQEDAAELFSTFINALSCYSSNANTFFNITTREEAKCSLCTKTTNSYAEHTQIMVPVNGDNIQACIKSYKKGERKQNCENPGCRGRGNRELRHITNSVFTSVSKFLVISLKRFAYEVATKSSPKITSLVKFDERLEINKFKFSLFAVVNHIGQTIESGHYTAYTKDTNGSWYLCNDRIITPVSFKEVVTPEAYMLFYQVTR